MAPRPGTDERPSDEIEKDHEVVAAGGTEADVAEAAVAAEPAGTADATPTDAGSVEPAADTGKADTQPDEAATTGRLAALWPPRVPSTGRGRIAAAAVVLVLALAVGGLAWWRAGVLPDGVAYAVGDTEVTVEQLDRELETLRALRGLQPPTDETGLATFRRDLAQASALGLVIDRAAAERGTVLPDVVVQDTLTRYVEEYFGGAGSRERFVQALGTAGTSEQEVLAETRRQLLIRQLFEDVTRDIAATDDEVRQAFDQRRAELDVPERRELQNIVVPTREQADQVVAELARGADFAALAAARSVDPSTKDKGGSLGALAAAQLAPGYAQMAFAAPQGSVFGPVETRFGWNVGRVGTILPAQPVVFEQVSERLRQQIRAEKASAAWRAWLTEQVEDADVRYADQYRPENPVAGPSRGGPAGPPGAPSPPR